MNESVSLQRIIRTSDDGTNEVRAIMNILLTDLVLFFNVGKMMDAGQIAQTRELLLEDFVHLKPEDFKLCFNRAKKGHYGPLYDRIDGQLILDWLRKYDNERDAEIEIIRANQNRDLKNASKTLITQPDDADEVFTRNWNKLQNMLEENKKEREAAKATAHLRAKSKDPIYMMHAKWFEQYHAIWKRQNYPRLIRRYGIVLNPFYNAEKPKAGVTKMIYRRLDKNGFLQHKQWQYNEFVVKGIRHYEVQ
jgi:hypothetical protein